MATDPVCGMTVEPAKAAGSFDYHGSCPKCGMALVPVAGAEEDNAELRDMARRRGLGLYALFMVLLVAFAPGYIERVWNLPDLSGVLLGGIPLEELAFGFAFGMYWAGLYEHYSWRAVASFGGHHA